MFSFDNAFELYNDIDILRKMELDCGVQSGSCTAENLKMAKSMLPKAFGDTLDGQSVTGHAQTEKKPYEEGGRENRAIWLRWKGGNVGLISK